MHEHRQDVTALDGVCRMFASLDAAALGALDPIELHAMVAAAARAKAAAESLWLRVSAAANRANLHAQHHARDAATYLAGVAGERVGQARRDVEVAAAVETMPSVEAALADGSLSIAKAAVLAGASDLPADVQAQLVANAGDSSVRQVEHAVRSARLEHGVHDPDPPSTCNVTRASDRVRVHADLGLVDGELVEVALDSMADAIGLPHDLPYAQRRAVALVALCRTWLDYGTNPPTTRVGRPHLLVVVDLDVLTARIGGTAQLASGAVITGDEARRIAADANVTRIITSGRSQVLDVGRTTRTVGPALAKAVIARDRHCRWHDCTAPPWACDIHHRIPWASGGSTNLANLGLVCWHHHQLIHRTDPQRVVDHLGRWHLGPPVHAAA